MQFIPQPYFLYQNQSVPQMPIEFINQVPSFNHTWLPQENIVGDGDILMAPGSSQGPLQLIFIPRNLYNNSLRPCLCNHLPCVCQSWPRPGSLNVWSVRNFFNQVPPLTQFVPSQNQICCLQPMQQNPQQIIFHRDGATSTSDLHYYFPRLRPAPWVPSPSAGVQTTPSTADKRTVACACNSREAVREKAERKRKKYATCRECEEFCPDCDDRYCQCPRQSAASFRKHKVCECSD